MLSLQNTTLDHVLNTTGSADNNLRAILQRLHVLADIGATDASVALNAHKVTDGDDDLLDLLRKLTGRGKDQSLASLEVGVNLLKGGNREGCRLASTGLGLSDDIVAWKSLIPGKPADLDKGWGETLTFDNGHNRTLLNSGRTLKTISVDTCAVVRNSAVHPNHV